MALSKGEPCAQPPHREAAEVKKESSQEVQKWERKTVTGWLEGTRGVSELFCVLTVVEDTQYLTFV